MSNRQKKPEEQAENENKTLSEGQSEQPEILPQKAGVSKSNIETMEVQKHPHHVMHQKKWKEYLLEFFMLFLAVFLGFIAENIREHLADQKKGKEYVSSFVEDLKKDTAQFSALINEYAYADSVTNEITACYDTVSHHPKSTDCLKTVLPYLTGFTDFIYTDRTIQQLKNAGGLRLIQDKAASDSIISYDALVRKELIHQDALEINQANSIRALQQEIDFISFHQLYSRGHASVSDPELLQTDRSSIDQLFNTLWIFKVNLRGQLHSVRNLKASAERLISYLQNK
jgi:hypothetical protein